MHRVLCLLIAAVLLASPVHADDWRYDGVSRVVALSDLHGAHAAFVRTLQQSAVIDEQEAWIGGDAHLVIVGDILDRGDDSRDSMDLLMRLEGEAEAAGGRVHVLIGNHEAMNLIGDMRYVAKGEYAAFADEETADERDRWFNALVLRDEGVDRAAFDADYPAGYFAHRRAFARDGKYGRWLLEKPLIVVINGTAFVHGGLSPMVGELGLDGVNGDLLDDMRDYVRMLPELFADGAVLPTDNFFDHPTILQRRIADLESGDSRQATWERAIALNKSRLHDIDGPFWYRGNVACSQLVEIDRLAASLAAIGADRVVIGHTPTPTRGILTRLDGKVIEIDTGMNAGYYKGSGTALVIEAGKLLAVSETGEQVDDVPPHPRQVGTRPGGFLPLEDTLEILSVGEIVDRRLLESGADAVTLEHKGRRLDAVFQPAERKGVMPELAAYRLDRWLGLDKVPATVARKLGRRNGTFQFLVPDTIDEQKRSSTALGGGAQCLLTDQWRTMYTFDALVHNLARTQRSMRYDVAQGFKLILTDHQLAFATERGFPKYLQSATLAVTPEWRRRLEALTDEVISEQFGDVLDRRRRNALAGRRELMLELDDDSTQ